jgi:thiol-disulfide isomerase/thioredoxin
MNLVFIYADWCPHCAKMKPWVKELMDEGYNVTWINIENKNDIKVARECLQGVAQLKYIPEFVCLSKKINKIGEFSSKEEMKNFFDNCVG